MIARSAVRIVYLATSQFAASVLDGLAEAGLEPVLVVTRPDRPRGRGRHVESPPVAVRARERGIPVLAPEDVNGPDAVAAIAAARPDAVCVCAFGALIKEPLLSDHELLNVHPSLLPRWRGAAPVERAIMAGDEVTGVSIMRVTAGLDSGPVCLAESEPISESDTYGTLAPRLEALGAALLARALRERPAFTEQAEELATYAEKIGPADRLLDPGRTAPELARVVRALHPHIGARVDLGDDLVCRVQSASVSPDASGGGPGQITARDGRLVLACAGHSALELHRIQPPGGRPMAVADFLRGHPGRW